MADDIGAATGDPGAGADPGAGDPNPAGQAGGEEGGELSFEALAQEYDANAALESGSKPEGGGDGGEGGEGTGSGGRKAPKGADPLDYYIETQYGGDRAAAVRGLFESRSEMSRLAAEVKDLREGVLSAAPKPTRDRDAEVKTAREASPDVQVVNQEIAAQVSRYKALEAKQLQHAQKASEIRSDIDKLNGELLSASTEEHKYSLAAKIAAKRSEFSVCEVRFENASENLDTISTENRRSQRELARLNRDVEDSLAYEESQRSSQERQGARTAQLFSASFDKHVAGYALDPKTDTRRVQTLRTTVRALLAEHLEARAAAGEEGLDALALSDAVGDITASLAETFGIQKRGGRFTAPVRGGVPRRTAPRPHSRDTVPGGNGGREFRPDSNTNKRTPEQIRERARALMAAAVNGVRNMPQ